MKELLQAADAAAIARVTPAAIDRAAREGRLRVALTTARGQRLYQREAVLEYVRNRALRARGPRRVLDAVFAAEREVYARWLSKREPPPNDDDVVKVLFAWVTRPLYRAAESGDLLAMRAALVQVSDELSKATPRLQQWAKHLPQVAGTTPAVAAASCDAETSRG
jgi:hypothetical protein